jgi:opacity protein-like surface antigen
LYANWGEVRWYIKKKEFLMRSCIIAVLIAVMIVPNVLVAQEAGSFIAGIEAGFTSAMGDFRNDSLNANTGFGLGAELRYALLKHISIGPFLRYHRFGSNTESPTGNISYNFTQLGGLGRISMIDVGGGNLYVVGGGGIFEPNSHTWSPDLTTNEAFESGTFFTGGLGLSTNPFASTIYELEIRYNSGNADKISMVGIEEVTQNYKFDFFYIAMKLSFNSKGIKPEPRY